MRVDDSRQWDVARMLTDAGSLEHTIDSGPISLPPSAMWLEKDGGALWLTYGWAVEGHTNSARDRLWDLWFEWREKEAPNRGDAWRRFKRYYGTPAAWSAGGGQRREKGCLDAFVKLADSGPEAVLRFAQRWGVLGICSHGLPASHNPAPVGQVAPGKWPYAPRVWLCEPQRSAAGHLRELVVSWSSMSSIVRAVLLIAARLHQDKLGNTEDWERLQRTPDDWRKSGMSAEQVVNYECLTLSNYVQMLLDWGNVRPRFLWNPSAEELPTLTLAGGSYTIGDERLSGIDGDGRLRIGSAGEHSLFGWIAIQTAFAVARMAGFGFCAYCGGFFTKGRTDQRYCGPSCRSKHFDANPENKEKRRSRKGGSHGG